MGFSEAWDWTLIYRDGTRFRKADKTAERSWQWAVEHGGEHGGVAGVEIRDLRKADGPPVSCLFGPGARPILFWRHRGITAISGAGEDAFPAESFVGIGWQETVRGVNISSILYLFDSGVTVLTQGDIDDHLLPHPISMTGVSVPAEEERDAHS